MTGPAFALGIDPGPTTGIVLLNLTLTPGRAGWADIYQCNAETAPWLLHQLLGMAGIGGASARCGIEAFARGRGPGARMTAGRKTADQVRELAGICAEHGVPAAVRNAGTVKPWAEGNGCKRLLASGLLDLVPGSAHAKSAAGQALYCAVFDCGYPDPLSRADKAG